LDAVIVGAGAAGLTTAIFAARRGLHVVALDGARVLGAKILVSGGGRCNVTNARVAPADFNTTTRRPIGQALSAFGVAETRAFFGEIGVALHEEERGKLFPDSQRARTVLEALIGEARARGAELRTGHRVLAVERHESGFRVASSQGEVEARRVVLAAGGLALPRSGSDGSGHALARSLGHTLVPVTPALVPLLLDGDDHAELSGVAHEVELRVLAEGSAPLSIEGPLLFTHFGISGPAALDASRHVLRARLEGRPVRLEVRLLPGKDAAATDRRLQDAIRERPAAGLSGLLAELLPASLAARVLARAGILGTLPAGRLARPGRLRLAALLAAWPLPVRDSRGWSFAETTAGGVPLSEVHAATLESRRCPGLHLAGEILDVDGRLGGFNFQWAWSSGWVAARGLALGLSGGRAGPA
jgi:predicted Rossmann fold flavoprotein